MKNYSKSILFKLTFSALIALGFATVSYSQTVTTTNTETTVGSNKRIEPVVKENADAVVKDSKGVVDEDGNPTLKAYVPETEIKAKDPVIVSEPK